MLLLKAFDLMSAFVATPTRVMLCGPCDAALLAQVHAQAPDLQLTMLRDRADGVPPGATWVDKSSLSGVDDLSLTPAQEDFHEQVMRRLMADSRSYFLLERIMTSVAYGTVFNGLTRVDQYVRRSIKLLDEHNPQRVIFMSTPHDILWFFAQTAEARGCEILVLKPGPMPDQIFVTRGLDAQTVLETGAGDATKARAQAQAFIALRQRSYAEAGAASSQGHRQRYGNKSFNLRTELRRALTAGSPREVVRKLTLLPPKRHLARTYEGLAVTQLDPAQQGRSVVLFLHYQPERSSLPEGGDYAQQLRVARTLAAALPDGWELLIKEHPDYYRLTFKPRVRDAEVYHAMARLPNTRLVGLGMDTFSLIDHAAAVVTLTGTVGIEGFTRGKPALVFGCACYQDAPGVTRVASLAQTRAALKAIAQGAKPDPQAVEDWLTWTALHAAPEHTGDPIVRRKAIIAALGAQQGPRPPLEGHRS